MRICHTECAFQDSFLMKMWVLALSSSESPRPLELNLVVGANNAPPCLTVGSCSRVGAQNNQHESDLSEE